MNKDFRCDPHGRGKIRELKNEEMRKLGNEGVGLLGVLGEARRDVENLWGEIAKRINILGGTLLLECKVKKT